MAGRIRLACMCCAREDCDGIDKLPDDWEDIDEVQSYEQSIQEVGPDNPGRDVTFWQTHIGVCPDCQNEDGEFHSDQGERCGHCDHLLTKTHITVNEEGVYYCSAICRKLAVNGQ